MESRILNKVNGYFNEFKTDIISYISIIENNNINIDDSVKNMLKNYLLDYKPFNLTKEDLQKRKRTKNAIPLYDRCCAKRANGEQCTRKKKDDEDYCGTHVKGIPHGKVDKSNSNIDIIDKIEVNIIDINGILYYVDNNNNVYNNNDVAQNLMNPRIIAKYDKVNKEIIFDN